MSNCCIISIGWLTSFVDYVHLVMSLVSHGLLYIHLVHLILFLRSCEDLDGIIVLCMNDCCMTTLSCLTACCMSMWDTLLSSYL